MSSVRSLLVLLLPAVLIATLWFVAYRDSVSLKMPRWLAADTEIKQMYQKALQASAEPQPVLHGEERGGRDRFTMPTRVIAREEAN